MSVNNIAGENHSATRLFHSLLHSADARLCKETATMLVLWNSLLNHFKENESIICPCDVV